MTQEFVTRGELRLSRSAAMRVVQQAELQYSRRRFDVLTSVRAQFYAAAVAQQRAQVLRNLLAIASRSRQIAGKLEVAGQASRADSLLMQIEQDRAQLALDNGETLLKAAYQQLAATVGTPELLITSVTADISAPLPNFEYEALRQGVVTQNALAQVAQLEISRSRILLQRAIVEPFPNIVAMGGYQRQVADAPVLDQGLFQVTVPIPLWNRNQGNIGAAQANVTAAAQQYGRVQNELALRAAQTLADYRTSVDRVERYEKQILPRTKELFDVAQRGYAAGEFDLFRLLSMQRTLLETNLTYVNAQESRWLAAAQIAGLLQTERFP